MMRPRLTQGHIRPQISTMPRQKTEAAAYLDIYKLVTEKKRLQYELDGLDERRDRIQKRLDCLAIQIAALEASAQQLRDDGPLPSSPTPVKPAPHSSHTTVFLEY